MNKDKREQLLTDALSAPSGEHYALAAAASARRHRRTRQVLGTASIALTLIAVGFLTYQPRNPLRQIPVTLAPAFETISDQELVAQLQGQSVLLVKGPAGINEVLFLAEKKLR